jgi:hypothetical protein
VAKKRVVVTGFSSRDEQKGRLIEEFQNGKNARTPLAFPQEGEIKEMSRDNVPVWRYDHGGRLLEGEKESRSRRGFIAATTRRK